jgi:hypothetical protein
LEDGDPIQNNRGTRAAAESAAGLLASTRNFLRSGTGESFLWLGVSELIVRNHADVRAHIEVAGTAEFVARSGMLARLSEFDLRFADMAGHNFDGVLGIGSASAGGVRGGVSRTDVCRKCKTVDDIGAGDAEAHRNAGGHEHAGGNKIELLGDQADGDGSVGFDGGSEIAFDELAAEMQRRGIDRIGASKNFARDVLHFIGKAHPEPDEREGHHGGQKSQGCTLAHWVEPTHGMMPERTGGCEGLGERVREKQVPRLAFRFAARTEVLARNDKPIMASFAPLGLVVCLSFTDPRLAPWAEVFCRFAAARASAPAPHKILAQDDRRADGLQRSRFLTAPAARFGMTCFFCRKIGSPRCRNVHDRGAPDSWRSGRERLSKPRDLLVKGILRLRSCFAYAKQNPRSG